MATAVIGALAGEGGSKLLGAVAGVINAIRGKDPAAAAELEKIASDHAQEFRLAELAQENAALQADVAIAAQQTDVNKIEAASTDFFTRGWRPSVGWVCSAGLGFQFLLRPLLTWGAALAGHPVVVPELDFGSLLTLLGGMLGLGGMRTFEKVRGASR